MKILFDQNTPWGLRKPLSGHMVFPASRMGWAEVRNGDLLLLAELSGYDLFLTGDKNIRYQQNLGKRRISITEITTTHWPSLRLCFEKLVQAVESSSPGSYSIVECPDLRKTALRSRRREI